MNKFLAALFLTLFLFGFASCELFTDLSVSVGLNSDRETYYSSRNIFLTADVANPSKKDLSYKWYRDGQLIGSGGKDFNSVHTTFYTKTSEEHSFSVEVSNGTNRAIATKKVTVGPYTESDAATVTITNSHGANLYQVIVAEVGMGTVSAVGTNVLISAFLAPNATTTITGLVPGQYAIFGLNIEENNPNGGWSGVYLVAGQNYYSIL